MEGDQIDPHNPPKVENQHSGFIVSVRVKPLDSDEVIILDCYYRGYFLCVSYI